MAQSAGRAAIVPKGDWSASVAYTRLDAVVNNNILYIAKIDVPSGTPLTDTTYWFQSINGAAVPIATTTTAGKVKPDGTTITIDADGTIHGSANVDIATTSKAGIVKPDGTTITIQNDGTIASPNETVELTRAEYDALPSSKLTDGKVYMIKDAPGAGMAAIGDLDDVEISDAVEGDALVYDSVEGVWVNGIVTIAGGGTGKYTLASTNYSAIEYRGESINSSNTTPTLNGTIAWKYE